MNNPPRQFPRQFPRRSPAVSLTPNPWPLIPALLLLLTLLISACGRRPTEPTPLPPGTRVAQPTPDFSAPAQVGSAPTNAAQALRTRLAQQRAQPTATPTVPPAVSPQFPRSSPAVSPDPSLAVFNRPNALGILAAGGILYTAPNGAARANLQVGATLTITGRSADNAWYAAYLADGTAGWVPANQVRVFGDTSDLQTVNESLGPAVVATLIAQASQPQTPITLAPTTPTPAVPPAVSPAVPLAVTPAVPLALTVIVEGANLRAGPGTDYPVVGGLSQNAQAPLLGRNQSGDWLQLQLPTGPAWIYAPLVQTTTPIPDLPLIDPPPDP